MHVDRSQTSFLNLNAKKLKKHLTREETLEFRGKLVTIVRRPVRKHLTIKVNAQQCIRVMVSLSVSRSRVESFLSDSWAWVLETLAQFKTHTVECKKFREGETFLLLGQEWTLRFMITPLKEPFFALRAGENSQRSLHCHIPEALWESRATLGERDANTTLQIGLRDFLRREAIKYLDSRMNYWLQVFKCEPRELVYKAMKSRWGSCNSRRKICLNWHLIVAPADVIDYVIVHEMSHMFYMNHSADFWRVVHEYYPNTREPRQWLGQQGHRVEYLRDLSGSDRGTFRSGLKFGGRNLSCFVVTKPYELCQDLRPHEQGPKQE
jgi:predicted metal-dependent hydrolase